MHNQNNNQASASERENITRLATILEGLMVEVREISRKLDDLKDRRIMELERNGSDLEKNLALTHSKVNAVESDLDKMRSIQHKIMGAIGLQLLGLITGLITWAIQRTI